MVKPFLHPTKSLSGDVLAAAAPPQHGNAFPRELPAVPRCISGASRWSPAAPACSAPAQPLTALDIKAALCVLVPPFGDKQMLLSSGAGNSSVLAFHCVLGQAFLLWSWTPAGFQL